MKHGNSSTSLGNRRQCFHLKSTIGVKALCVQLAVLTTEKVLSGLVQSSVDEKMKQAESILQFGVFTVVWVK